MKKALGLLALVAGASALVAYKVLKDEKVKVIEKENDVEKHIIEIEEDNEENDEVEEEEEAPASYTTASYPNLNTEDMIHLNDVSESVFETIDFDTVGDEDHPIQHVLHFENRLLMEKFKSIVIEEGYVVSTKENEFDLMVLHIGKVDVDFILSKVFYLANLAKECDGSYINWILK